MGGASLAECMSRRGTLQRLDSLLVYAAGNLGQHFEGSLPTGQCKLSLRTKRELLDVLCKKSHSAQTHSSWLSGELNGVIRKSKRRKSCLLNEEKLWSTYHQLTMSTAFQQRWESSLQEKICPKTLYCTST